MNNTLEKWLFQTANYCDKNNVTGYRRTKYLYDALNRYIIYSNIKTELIHVMKKFYQSEEMQNRFSQLVKNYELEKDIHLNENCKLMLIQAVYIESLSQE
jgi:hypothetical protein